MGLRQAKKDEMHQRLYESAVELFRERGFEGTRVRDIVERVGVSEATFFNYFPTKEAILQKSAATTKHLYGEFLGHLIKRDEEPATFRLRELTRGMAAVCQADQPFLATVVGRTTLLSGSEGEEKTKDLENFDLLADLFAQGMDSGEINRGFEPLQLAEVFVAIQTLTITNWATGWWQQTQPLEARMLAALEVLFSGCTTSKSSSGAHDAPSTGTER